MYSVTVEPLHHNDPRAIDRSVHNKTAREAVASAGLSLNKTFRTWEAANAYAEKVNDVLEPLNRSALVTRMSTMSIG